MMLETGYQGTHGGRIELEQFVNRRTVEAAYARVLEEQMRPDGRNDLARLGYKAACARDGKLLRALDEGAEVLHEMAEQQMGRTSRDASRGAGEKVWATEAQLWREAYVTADRGAALENFGWIYGAAAILAGLTH